MVEPIAVRPTTGCVTDTAGATIHLRVDLDARTLRELNRANFFGDGSPFEALAAAVAAVLTEAAAKGRRGLTTDRLARLGEIGINEDLDR